MLERERADKLEKEKKKVEEEKNELQKLLDVRKSCLSVCLSSLQLQY